jgi:cytochrome c-type biogenesis protein CcmH
MLNRLAFILLLLTTGPVAAQHLDDRLADPAQEQRARELSRELRCLVCQNQSIEDSNAPLARDLRHIVRERVALGENDQAILDYLVARYGEWVLLKPRFTWQTWVLWLGPAAFLLIGGGVVVTIFRRQKWNRATAAVAMPLNDAEQTRLKALLDDEGSR